MRNGQEQTERMEKGEGDNRGQNKKNRQVTTREKSKKEGVD